MRKQQDEEKICKIQGKERVSWKLTRQMYFNTQNRQTVSYANIVKRANRGRDGLVSNRRNPPPSTNEEGRPVEGKKKTSTKEKNELCPRKTFRVLTIGLQPKEKSIDQR